MKPNKKDLKQVIEFLIQRLEKHSFESRFEDKERIIGENVFTSGKITAKCCVRVNGNNSTRCFDFLITLENETVYRGIIGYIPILYTRQNRKLRESLLIKETIEGIITIRHSAQSFSQIAIIIFDKKDSVTQFVSCDRVENAVSFLLGEDKDAVSVCYSEIIHPENWLPDYYSQDQNLIDATFQRTQTKCLEELAEIIPGKGARSSDYRENGIPYLRARDIQKGDIVTGAVCLESKMVAGFSRQLIQEGDILLTKLFGQRKLALVTADDLPAIVSNGLYIIRPFGVSERYLYRYLTSKTGNAIFNLQLKRIESGKFFSSISLSDLKKIQVPVYDEDTMLNFEQMDTLTNEDGIEAALRIIRAIGNESEVNIEKRVYDELLLAGWNAGNLSYQDGVIFENSKRWTPDLTYTLPDNTKVYFEIKSVISKVSAEWASAIKRLLQGPDKCFYVLTTGYYYEVHVTGNENSLKILHVPTLNEILDWERGQN